MRPPVLPRNVYLAAALAGMVVMLTPIMLTSWLTPGTRASTLEQANTLLNSDDLHAQSITEAAQLLGITQEGVENDEGFDVETELAAFIGQARVTRLLLVNSGIYALLQILFTLAAAGILAWTFFRLPNQIDFGAFVAPGNLLAILLSFLLFVVAGLDIYGLTLPAETYAPGTMPLSMMLTQAFAILMVVYLGVVPLIVAAVPWLASVVDRFHIPVAGWPVGIIATLAVLLPDIPANNGRPIELLFSILLALLAAETLWIEKHGQPQGTYEPLSWRTSDGIQVSSIDEAAAAMSITPDEDGEVINRLADHIGSLRSTMLLFAEDGIYETIQAALCGAGAIVLLWTFFRCKAPFDYQLFTTQRNWFVLLLAMMMIVMLGEEISWGQRLLGFNTPEWLTQRNFQGEFTFHNMRAFQEGQEGNSLEMGWMWVMVSYLGVVPLVVLLSRPLAAWTKTLGFPVPDWPIAVITIVLFIMNTLLFRTSEVTELILDILLVAFAVEIYSKASEALAKEESQWLAFAVGAWATLWVVATPFQAGEDALPSVRSTDLYKSALVMIERGDRDDALATLEESLATWPNNVRAHHSLGLLLLERQDTRAAIEHLNTALQIEPRFIPSLLTSATVYSQQGQWAEAIEMFRRVIEAEPEFQRVLSRRSDLLQSANNVAWIMATQPDESLRDGFGAVELSKQVCEATDFQQPSYLDTYAAALAETGDFQQASEIAKQAIDLAIEADKIGLAGRIQERLNHYQDGEPYRDNSRD
ncbi:unnamed protein product [Cladocopium goreaui]|uniref:UDP-N-acetylglucosamine--peptide N-acetylglucosaminyltransferase (O-GlcNAc) (OGT) n=1 Tax=Cladocopium goreaui TaxID=2562237 RepID=A0A9P1FCQ4_9DINO|nr:unnamed protein product [Cladocopium goreaui]